MQFSNFHRRLFPRDSRGSSATAFRRLLPQAAAAIATDGTGRATLSFFKRQPALWDVLAGRQHFRTPPSCVRWRVLRTESAATALELSALLLIRHAPLLKRFEEFRTSQPTNGTSAEASLQECEKSFGYSDWLACKWLRILPPGSKRQVALTQALVDLDNSPLTSITVSVVYSLTTGSHAGSDVSRLVREREYPAPFAAYLTACLDPTPDLRLDAIADALAWARSATPIDHWLAWLKLLQACLVHHELPSTVAQAGISLDLLRAVGSIETTNVLRELGHQCDSPSNTPTTIEQWLPELGVAPNVEAGSTATNPVGAALQQVMLTGHVAGPIAVLDRAAVAFEDGRGAIQLAALAEQLSSFTERRAAKANHWFRLATHPDALAHSGSQSIGRPIRLASVPADQRASLNSAIEQSISGSAQDTLVLLRDCTHLSAEGQALLVDALLRAPIPEQILPAAAKLIAEHPKLVPRMPFDELEPLLSDYASDRIEEALSSLVVASAAIPHGYPQLTEKRNDLFEDVLDIADTRMPAEASAAFADAGIAPSIISYFFEHICVLNVMDTVPVGRSTAELCNARIGVLNELRTLDPTRKESYDASIKEMAVAIAVRRELASLDQQRVYVDIDGLSTRLTAVLASDFERYLRYTQLDRRKHSTATLFRILKEQFPDITLLDESELTRALTSEADRAFAKMVNTTRTEFALGNEFGLDGYLSGGIRHGNLEAHLREPFVKRDLLGTFRGEQGFRLPDSARALGQFAERPGDVELAYRSFASGFQSAIDEVLHEWVRVELNDLETRAIFDLTLTRGDVRLIEATVAACSTAEAAVKALLDYYLARVDTCLELAQVRIRTELAQRLHKVLDDFIVDLRSASPDLRLDPIIDNVLGPTRGSLDIAISKLAEWFIRAERSGDTTVEASLPMEVSGQLIKRMHPAISFGWRVKVEDNDIRLSRRVLKHWVDIFHTILTNAAENGVVRGRCDIEVQFELSIDGARIEVRNGISESTSDDRVDSIVIEAMNRLSERDALHAVRKEGHSGLVKVLKYAQVDLRCPSASVAVRRDGRAFVTTVVLPGPLAGLRLEQ